MVVLQEPSRIFQAYQRRFSVLVDKAELGQPHAANLPRTEKDSPSDSRAPEAEILRPRYNTAIPQFSRGIQMEFSSLPYFTSHIAHHASLKLTFSRCFPQLSLSSLSVPSRTIHALGEVQKWPWKGHGPAQSRATRLVDLLCRKEGFPVSLSERLFFCGRKY